MSDGTVLRADVWLPSDGGSFPTLLQRTAYDKSNSFNSIVLPGLEPLRAVADGFAVVIQDTRGRFASDGSHRTFADDTEDGTRTVEWITRQPFCDGRVCSYGLSHNGLTQFLLASRRPGGLRAIAPAQATADCHDVWTYQGGAFQLGFCLLWATRFLAPGELGRRAADGRDVRELATAFAAFARDPWAAYRRTPLVDVGPLAELCPEYVEWVRHPERDDFCNAFGLPPERPNLDVPALQIGGWYDLFLPGTLAAFESLAETASASDQRLVVGPWGHGAFGGAVGELDFGPTASLAALDPTGLHLEFFKAILAGERPPEPPVRLFVMGPNIWRDEYEWPLARARERRLYLGSGGRANSAEGDGRLEWEPPRASQPPDAYVYDPRTPVPTCGGATFLPGLASGTDVGPRDQSAVERRNDVLVYTSSVLAEDWEVTGYVTVSLFAMTTAPDTDWTAKLVDVDPDGRLLSVCDGIVRARYHRRGLPASPVPAGAVERYDIDLGATSTVLRARHRIRLQISSSNFPRFDRNPNTGGVIALTSLENFEPARQSVFHDAEHPSFLALPVVPHL
jgi:hypothetical protein